MNKFSWNKTLSEMNDYEKAQAPMIKKLRDRIISRGCEVLNSKPTKIQGNFDNCPSCLDLVFTNEKQKIINHDTIQDTF